MRKLAIFAISAIVIALGASAYAEVQNVKVSGKVNVTAAYRDAYVEQGVVPAALGYDENYVDGEAGDYLLITSKIGVQADLTDNVSANVVIRSQKEAGSDAKDNLDVVASYITLSEFLYSSVTVKAGFFPYRLGSALILGDGTPGSTNLTYADLSEKVSFDGVLADIALDNATVTLGYLKPRVTGMDDRRGDIFVVDSNMDINGAALELYYVYDGSDKGCSYDENTGAPKRTTYDNERNYVGGRVSGDLMEGLTGSFEVAYLFGDYKTATESKDYDALAIEAGLNYAVTDTSNVGLGVTYLSGDKDIAEGNANTGDYEAWDAPYEDQVIGEVADFDSNVLAIDVNGSVQLADDINLTGKFYHFIADEDVAKYKTAGTGKDDDLGNELDLYLTWDYTPDVQFGLTVASFWPGDAFEKDDTAYEVLGGVTVNF